MSILIVVASMSAPFIGAYSWILLLGRSGVITEFFAKLGISTPTIYGFWGIVLVMTLQLFPLVFLYGALLLSGVEIGTATGVVILSWIIIPGGISFLFYRRKFP